MLDENGLIKVPAGVEIQHNFRPAVDDVVAVLRERLGDLIHSIYLYGSVARGAAVAGISDLDICLLLTRQADENEQRRLAAIKSDIARKHTVVSKIDFDIGTLEEALNPENLNSWGYWLKHHCRCLYGDDLALRFPRFRPSRAVALAVNGDFSAVLEGYITKLRASESASESRQLCRAAARKLIRSTSILRGEDDTDWPDSLEDHLQRFASSWPTMSESLRYFYEQSLRPQDDVELFIARLRTFMMWLKGRDRDLRYTLSLHLPIHSDPQ